MTDKYIVVTTKGNTTTFRSLITGDIRKHAEKEACDLMVRIDRGMIDDYYIYRVANGKRDGINEYDAKYTWKKLNGEWTLFDGRHGKFVA